MIFTDRLKWNSSVRSTGMVNNHFYDFAIICYSSLINIDKYIRIIITERCIFSGKHTVYNLAFARKHLSLHLV